MVSNTNILFYKYENYTITVVSAGALKLKDRNDADKGQKNK